jgi:hypothetical protein
MKMEQTERSETLAFKIQTPGNHPEENIQHSEHGESLKSRKIIVVYSVNQFNLTNIFPGRNVELFNVKSRRLLAMK